MLDGVPWAVNGGRIDAALARKIAYDSTGGATGVTLAGDMRVLPLAVPGAAVRVTKGSGTMLNLYPGGDGQSYGVQNLSDTNVDIPPTGSAGTVVHYLIVRIDDPDFVGQPPEDVVNGPYTRFVLVGSLANLQYPHIPLAKITIPANTATITSDMIEDLRKVANPKTDEFDLAQPAISGDNGMVLNGRQAYPDGEWFPNFNGTSGTGYYRVFIPKWATRMVIRMEWLGIRYANKAGWGWCWVAYGPGALTEAPQYATQAFGWDADETANIYRTNWLAEQEVEVRPEWRGTYLDFSPRAHKLSPATAEYPGTVELTALSGTSFKVKFKQVADVHASIL